MFDYNASISSSNFHREPMLQIQGDKPGSQATGVRHGFGTMSWLIRMFFMKICNFLCKKIQVSFPPFHLQFLFLWYFMSMSTSELQYSEFWYPRCKVVIIGLTVCLAPKERRWCGFAAATAMGTRGQVCSFKVAKQFWNKRVELPKKKEENRKTKLSNCFPGRKSLQSLRCRPGLPDLPFGLSMQLPCETCIERENIATAGPLVCAICPICAICVPSLFFLWFFGNKNGNSVTIEAKTGPDRQVQSRKRHGFLAFSKKKLEAHSNIENLDNACRWRSETNSYPRSSRVDTASQTKSGVN